MPRSTRNAPQAANVAAANAWLAGRGSTPLHKTVLAPQRHEPHARGDRHLPGPHVGSDRREDSITPASTTTTA